MKFDVLNRFDGSVQFTAEIECNEDEKTTIKLGLAVKWAIKNKANLSFADLRSANLRSADLRSANLSSADLRSANLSFADLSFADLRSATLSSADLRSADLSFADLRFADLRSADLRILKTNIWTCYIQHEHIRIGCQHHTVKDWDGFSDKEISEMSAYALSWWKVWKPIVMAIQQTIILVNDTKS